MTTSSIATQLVTLCRQGDYAGAVQALYAQNATSIEPVGEPRQVDGIEGIMGKGEWFRSTFDVKAQEISEPIVSGDHFCLRFRLDTVNKQSGEASVLDELAVYKVAEGKVVLEQFFY